MKKFFYKFKNFLGEKVLKWLAVLIAFFINASIIFGEGDDSDSEGDNCSHKEKIQDKGKQMNKGKEVNREEPTEDLSATEEPKKEGSLESKAIMQAWEDLCMGNDFMRERMKRINDLLIGHTEKVIKSTEEELKSEDLLNREDNELTPEELERKKDLLDSRDKDIDELVEDLQKKVRIENKELELSKDKSFEQESSTQNKRSLDEDNSKNYFSKKKK